MYNLKTPTQVKNDFRRRGITITSWARKHGIHHQIVRDLLDQKLKGNYGTAHRAAVLLKLVDGEVEEIHHSKRKAA